MNARTAWTIVGAVSALGIAGTAIAAAVANRDDESADPASTGGSPASGDVEWQPDAGLPDVTRGGASQATWAASVLTRYDADQDGDLDRLDANRSASAWGSSKHVITGLIDRYDTSGDQVVDDKEATRIGADVARDGVIDSAAVERLRRALRA